MRPFALIIGLCMVAGQAWADDVCPDINHTCLYTVDTRGAPLVSVRAGGYAVEKRQWIDAPADKYFVNPSVTPSDSAGQNVACEIDGSDGVQERDVPLAENDTIPMRFVKKYLIVAHAESGAGQYARAMCVFNAQVSTLPH